MKITESTLRQIVREEIAADSLRSGRLNMREGRQLVQSGLLSEGFFDKIKGMFGGKKKGEEKGKPAPEEKSDPDEVKSMGLKTGGDEGPTKFEKGKVYDLPDATYKIRPEQITGETSMESRLIYARRSTNFMIKSYYDSEKDETTTYLIHPSGKELREETNDGDLNTNHGKHAARLRVHIPDEDLKKMNQAGFKGAVAEAQLRRIVREEFVSESVRAGRMTLREGRRILNEGFMDAIADTLRGVMGTDDLKPTHVKSIVQGAKKKEENFTAISIDQALQDVPDRKRAFGAFQKIIKSKGLDGLSPDDHAYIEKILDYHFKPTGERIHRTVDTSAFGKRAGGAAQSGSQVRADAHRALGRG
jgi:hypothetical protein